MSRCITISRLRYRGSSIHVSHHNSYSSLSSIYIQYNTNRRDPSTNCYVRVVPNLIYGVSDNNNNACNDEYTATTTATNFRRLFSSSSSSSKTKNKKIKVSVDPFKILGITKFTPYAKAKKKFLMIAMKHHPDTTSAKSEEEQEKHYEIFISSREAFEALVVDEDTGGVMIREEKDGEGVWEDAAMDQWFKDETGYDMPFMDQKTMKEVAEATETMGGGMARDGGMWELAKMVSKSVKDGANATSILQLDVGDVNNQYKNRIIDGKLRRRKR